jgi:aspartate 1-decarboxylase
MFLNGPAARTGLKGDRIIVLSYCQILEEHVESFTPLKVQLKAGNKIASVES